MTSTNETGLGTTHDVREATYQRKLAENIELKRTFLDIGGFKYSQLNKGDGDGDDDDDDEMVLLKKETIAIYDSLKNVPFKPERDDLIGISLAGLSLSLQNEDLTTLNQGYQDLISRQKSQIQYLESLIFNLSLTGNLVISKNRRDPPADLRAPDWARIAEDLDQRDTMLVDYTKRLLSEYVMGQVDSEKQGKYLELIESLLNNLLRKSNEFIQVPAELKEDLVLRQLLSSHIIEQRDSLRVIRLTKFGF